jgi:hypothetical protein
MGTATAKEQGIKVRRTTALREYVEIMRDASDLAAELPEMDPQPATAESLTAYSAIQKIREQLERVSSVVVAK